MVTLSSLVVPIVVSAVLVFIMSSIIHMALGYHRADYAALPNEDGILEAFRANKVSPGDYVAPYANSSAGMQEPAYQEKLKRGPGLVMTVWPGGSVNMGTLLGQWFLYSLIVSVFTAYLLSRIFPAGADYLAVFRVAGTVTFMAYGFALPQASIWYRKSWGTTLRSMLDAFIYGLLTAGAFGWLWP